jgi:hypothetical protein
VVKVVFPRLGRLPAPPALVVIPLVEAFEVRCGGRMPTLELVVSRGK